MTNTQTETPEIKEGYVIEYYHVRWAPYKKDGARQMRKKGRWQCSNGYGGYENCDTPERIYPCPIDYDSAAKLKAERDAALARVTVLQNSLEGLLSEVDALIGDSQGVYGLHLNGDNSPWDELGDWLPSRDTSRAAITAWNALKEQS